MSAPPSPHLSQNPAHKRDRPTALDIPTADRVVVSDAEVSYGREHSRVDVQQHQFQVNISVPDEPPPDPELPPSRSASATSSLDPYYFGIQSESESQSPLATTHSPSALHPVTPDYVSVQDPVTPARNPAMIDRRGLVGVGELATPRWAHHDRGPEQEDPLPTELDQDMEAYDIVAAEDAEEDQPDSPWTIEAIDGESSEKEEAQPLAQPPIRTLRTKSSIADESGGEEVVYPRNIPNHQPPPVPELLQNISLDFTSSDDQTPKLPRHASHSSSSEAGAPNSPPSSYTQSSRRARKRTSDEFIYDQTTGSMVPKDAPHKDKPLEEKGSVRKHHSLNVNTSSSLRSRDRARDSVGGPNGNKSSPMTTKLPERHARQSSTGSASSNLPDSHHARRMHPSDFSHLPPSPSSSSIQQFLRQTPGNPPLPPQPPTPKDSTQVLASPNVAHSLLRGTQEGWSGLDDEATAEALRKLDGLTGKSARARASVGSFRQMSGSSRPGTPPSKGSHQQWEGIPSESAKSKRVSAVTKDPIHRDHVRPGPVPEPAEPVDVSGTAISSDEQGNLGSMDKTPRKSGGPARLSFTPKRGSTSSTTYTGTPSSRDSASMSAATSVTSVSATSGRQSSGKGRRNSAGSDISSIHSTDIKDRVASIAVNGEGGDELEVPPVPPLPKDLANFRSPPSTGNSLNFPPPLSSSDREKITHTEGTPIRNASLEVPVYTSPIISPPPDSAPSSARRQSQHYSSPNESLPSPAAPKTPSKKWSISMLNKFASSPSTSSSSKSSFPLSPRTISFGQQLRKSTSKDTPASASSVKEPWSPDQPNAMASSGSLVSLSSVGSMKAQAPPMNPSKTPDRGLSSSRPGTSSSASTNHTTSALSAPPPPGPLSPSASIRRGHSKRLTPSSIPFFRRSSSQSMQLPPNAPLSSTSPTFHTTLSTPRSKQTASPIQEYNSSMSTSAPGTSHKKSSVLSLGLPSLLKSSSRRSLHSEAKEAAKEAQRARDAAKESEKERLKQEKERQKKEDKERSESRISTIINRKRGKTLSSTDPRKPKSPVNLPPMQISALEPVTAQRVAKLKSSANTTPTASNRTSTSSSSSRLTSQTVSSMQKQSDSSLRSRNQLPTIAGSPSVATNSASSSQTLQYSQRETRDPPSVLSNSASGLPKETPTKIPRISSRTSAAASPPLKGTSTVASRRTSALAASANPSPTSITTNEFGVIEGEDAPTPKVRQPSGRMSPPATTSRVPRQSTATAPTVASVQRKGNRDSVSFMGLRKSSTNSVASLAASGPSDITHQTTTQPQHHHRLSILSPSKGLKLLQPKSSRTPASASHAQQQQPQTHHHQQSSSPSSSRQSLSTPSPVPSTIDEEELMGDEEMMAYIRRQHAKKLAQGASQEELDEMLKFPEPIPPTPAMAPTSVLKSSHAQYLSEFEKREILDYPSVYCVGADSRKNMATLDNPLNNHGYDDERGDYLVVEHDHLAYRYEVISTLGKGSFGQVLNCRDHATGESMAVKIIRNKKRFHHQALVEIKILDNLRKWDPEEKHHVIKMTEHFYFRNHLCIAMELLSINLYELIKANGFVGFTTSLIRRFTNQMLLSLSLMRHHRIVHCDLKPENVLLRHPAKSAIKVIDFGSSCLEHEKIYTYIQSRFYRSPEVILGMNYHMAIDMWSLGCILAELYTGFPIFPGENEQEQLACIMEVLGLPDREFIARSSRRKLFFDTNGVPRPVVNSKGRRRRPGSKTLAQVLRCSDDEFVDFVSKCLVWDPERRIKPQAAMRHPFVTATKRKQQQIAATPSSKHSVSSSNFTGSRNKQVTETPKKSLISAPTPLTARSSRTGGQNGGLATPSSSHAQPLTASISQSSRSYRTSQAQNLSSTFGSSRTLTGYASSSNKG